jgi:hypothetical protein
MPSSRLLATRYGARAGVIGGLCASALVGLAYAYFRWGRGAPNPDGALAGGLLLGSVLGFPGSLAVLALIERLAPGASWALLAGLHLMPVVNWLALGAAAGAVVDLGRAVAGRSARTRPPAPADPL